MGTHFRYAPIIVTHFRATPIIGAHFRVTPILRTHFSVTPNIAIHCRCTPICGTHFGVYHCEGYYGDPLYGHTHIGTHFRVTPIIGTQFEDTPKKVTQFAVKSFIDKESQFGFTPDIGTHFSSTPIIKSHFRVTPNIVDTDKQTDRMNDWTKEQMNQWMKQSWHQLKLTALQKSRVITERKRDRQTRIIGLFLMTYICGTASINWFDFL